jgi:cysteine desulfurase
MFKKPRTYLDYAAATPLHPEAFAAMLNVLHHSYGNPSAIHQEGQQARNLLDEARQRVALTVQSKPDSITFTGGGTEANNLAILGTIARLHHTGRPYEDMQVITTRIEHPATTESVLALAARGVDVQFVEVDQTGLIQVNQLRSLLSAKTVLVSFAYANSEVGVIQSVHQLHKIITDAEKVHGTKIMIHLDAAQAPTWLTCQFDTLKADLVSLDFSKCGGPKGVGALLRSRRSHIKPILLGGGQEQGLRSGTENVVGVVGGATAFVVAQRAHKTVAERTKKVRDAGITELLDIGRGIVLNGPVGEQRIANNINISLPGVDTEYAAVWLDKAGFAVSTKSACAGTKGGKSAVVHAMTGDRVRASSTLRLTLSPSTTVQNLHAFGRALRKHLSMVSGLTQN